MNACGQHNMANIGFQGMSIKAKNNLVAPALQVLLGGGNSGRWKRSVCGQSDQNSEQKRALKLCAIF